MPPKKKTVAGKPTARELMAMVNKAVGADVLKMGSDSHFKVGFRSTGLLPFDIAMLGGIPTGRFVLVTGDYSTLKTYVGLHAIAQAQQRDELCALIDTEHAFDPEWAWACGVDVDELILLHPKTGELAIDAAEGLLRGGIDLIVFDSVAAALPEGEAKKRMSEENIQPARIAQLMSAGCRRLTAANQQNASIFWINQMRANIGITFGPTEVITGGRALPYYASYIINIKKAGKITKDVKQWQSDKWAPTKEQIGQKFKIEVQKSKLSRPFREVWFDWSLQNNDIDIPAFLIAQGLESGKITQSGNTWKYKDGNKELKAVGREKFKIAVAQSNSFQKRMDADIRKHYGLDADGGITEGEVPDVPEPEPKPLSRKKTMKPVGKKRLLKKR